MSEPFSKLSHYELRHLLDHLLEARMWQEASALITPHWRDAKRRIFGSDVYFLDDLARFTAAPVAPDFDEAERLRLIILAVLLKDSQREDVSSALVKMVERGDFRQAFEHAEGIGLAHLLCWTVLKQAAGGPPRPAQDLLETAACRLSAVPDDVTFYRVVGWMKESWQPLVSNGYDVDALCVAVARECARWASELGNRPVLRMAHLLRACGPALGKAALTSTWDLAFQVLATVSADSGAMLNALCSELATLAQYCPDHRRDTLLETVKEYARRGGGLTAEAVSYQLVALESCGAALAHLLKPEQIFALSLGLELGFGGSLSTGRAQRTALRLGAAEEYARLGRLDELDYLARHFVHPGARLQAFAWLLVRGPIHRLDEWHDEFFAVLSKTEHLAERDSSLFQMVAVLERTSDAESAERLLARGALRRAAEVLAQAPPERLALLSRATRALAARGAESTTPSPSAPSGTIPPEPAAPHATERLLRLAAYWHDPPAPSHASSSSSQASGAPPIDPAATPEMRRFAESILAAVEQRCRVGPALMFVLSDTDRRGQLFQNANRSRSSVAPRLQSPSPEVEGESQAFLSSWSGWSDSACDHARRMLDEVAGEEGADFFGPSERSVRRFDGVYLACSAAIDQQRPYAAALLRCACMAAQDLRRGGSTGKLGPVRVRAKLLVARLVGKLSRKDLEGAFFLAHLNLYAEAFSVSQILDCAASAPADRRDAAGRSIDVEQSIEHAVRQPVLAALLKARWMRLTGNADGARGFLEQAHDLLEAWKGTEEAPSLTELYRAAVARQMGRVDGPVGFTWSGQIGNAVLRCSSQLVACCDGPGWSSQGRREAVVSLLADLGRNDLLTSALRIGAPAQETIAETRPYPSFPPLSWKEATDCGGASAVSQLVNLASADSPAGRDGLAQALDDVGRRSDRASQIVPELARATGLPLGYVVRASRSLRDRPFDEFAATMQELAVVLNTVGRVDFCQQVATGIRGLLGFF